MLFYRTRRLAFAKVIKFPTPLPLLLKLSPQAKKILTTQVNAVKILVIYTNAYHCSKWNKVSITIFRNPAFGIRVA